MHHRSARLFAAAAAAVVTLLVAALFRRREQSVGNNVYVIVGRGDVMEADDNDDERKTCVVCGVKRVEFALAQRDNSDVVTFCSRGCLEQYILYQL